MDGHTEHTILNGISRRRFLRCTAISAGSAGVLGLAGCSPRRPGEKHADSDSEFGKSSDGAATLSFMPKPALIAEDDIRETKTFDVVIVGAGASGVPAALSAAEDGAKVAVLQKENIIVSQGNSGAGIDLAMSDPAGIEALVALLMKENAHRSNPRLLQQWAYNSGEAVTWVIDRAKQSGAHVIDHGNLPQSTIVKISGYKLNYNTAYFGPKPYTNGEGMQALGKT